MAADPVQSFFFQAGDGIRCPLVTGVQTCALPIFDRSWIEVRSIGPSWNDKRQQTIKSRRAFKSRDRFERSTFGLGVVTGAGEAYDSTSQRSKSGSPVNLPRNYLVGCDWSLREQRVAPRGSLWAHRRRLRNLRRGAFSIPTCFLRQSA